MDIIMTNYNQPNRKEVPPALTSMWDFKSDHPNIITKEFQHIPQLKLVSSSHYRIFENILFVKSRFPPQLIVSPM